ncbi:hypothetical protein EDB85DRAFT_1377240 [Lactarius pseudohatsudake]|nr:hypothetical protein EDB85DRAFT_1377240 [Lactarius pseudohatsudake]
MAVVTTELKKVFNSAHNRLHDSILPLGIHSPTEPPSSTTMSAQSNGSSPPLPDININIFKSDTSISQRLKNFSGEFSDFFEHLKFIILIPLSWFMTMFKFFRVIVWRLFTLPLRLSINFYERRVRERFPWLPSIWGTLSALFPGGIKFPTFTSITAGPYKGAGPIGKNETLNVDSELDAILNGTNGPAGNGSGDPSSQVNTNRSKLETALKEIMTFSPGNLDAALEQVKVRTPHDLSLPTLIGSKAAQAETEKPLKLTDPE